MKRAPGAHVIGERLAKRSKQLVLRTINHAYETPHTPFRATTRDGVSIAGVHLRRQSDTVVIYAHGFLSNKYHRAVPAFVEHLATHFDAIAFDFRGHGESGGRATFGELEVLDVEAVVAYARRQGYHRIITVGSSMGGAAVLLHAALLGGVDGVATIGAVAHLRYMRSSTASLGLRLLFKTRLGRVAAEMGRGTRIGALRISIPPVDVVHRIREPVLFIHGEWDPLIAPESALALYERAVEPKTLRLLPRTGHDIPILTPQTADFLTRWIRQAILGGAEWT
ncbi:hypothetical protein ARMA_1496 [Ardenticatena maritima]|uniref:AB hydrolase-1 domain-containing protein n=1 Tax=Ardenticatena maritima TaxID=872965 RepID=A0A0M8K6Y5_9CHLR|nr:hypothetical protein ARMA_1496 [Ardenticatena maritima]